MSKRLSHSWLPSCLRIDLLVSAVYTLLFVRLHGLPIGVGNQSLHLAWLKHLRDPSLFANDPLIESFQQFPTLFFSVFARLVPQSISFETALMVCQVVNTLLLFLALQRLARTLTPGIRLTGLIPLPLLLLPTHALAETPLPPLAFSHTTLGLTLALFALPAVFRERWLRASILFGLLINVHLLTAAYAGAIATLYVICRIRNLKLKSLLLPMAVGSLMAYPTLFALILSGGGPYDAAWLALLRERSAHHVFPDSWWQTGDTTIGTYALQLGWLAVLLATLPGYLPGKLRRTAFWLAPILMMLLATTGAYLFPHPLLLRAQLFRASLYPLLLSLCLLPAALDYLWPRFTHPAARMLMVAVAGCWLLPACAPLQPYALALALGGLWASGHLRARHALAASLVFPLLALSDRVLSTRFFQPNLPAPATDGLILMVAGLLLLSLVAVNQRTMKTTLAGCSILLLLLSTTMLPAGTDHRGQDLWVAIQSETRIRTPPQARILTPFYQSGFRDHAHRAIIGEWRDGTMQFFDPSFAQDWARRMQDLNPDRLASFSPADWVDLGKTYHAEYAVLPANRAGGLVQIAANPKWALVKTERPPPPPLPDPPAHAADPEDWTEQERFLAETVDPNIERHRIRKTTLQLTDEAGLPLAGLPIDVRQTRLAFRVGSALHHFSEVPQRKKGFNAPPVHPRELELFSDIFNFSVIGYSGKWNFIEPEAGDRRYEDLDAYVDWCIRNNIEIQFHFVTGYEPRWVKKLADELKRKAVLAHANDLIDRYGDRINQWQIVNEGRMLAVGPELFDLFRERQAGDELGVSHCTRFYTDRSGEKAERDLLRGMRELTHIQNEEKEVDFFAIHAHRPNRVWCDPRTMYKVLDDFHAKDVRLYVSEACIPSQGSITGSLAKGKWTPELQADYLTRFIKTLYSHPGVDGINFWGYGKITWQKNTGLLDEDYNPLPAYYALKKLVRDEWNSQAAGRTGSSGDFYFRGHKGEYELTLRLPDGQTATGTFTLSDDTPDNLPVKVIFTPSAS